MCTCTVSVLAHIFEAAGIATVGISLVRRQAENARPPRMLNVNFPLGRPLGRPDDAEFQRDVLNRAFALLDRTDVPVLVDHPVTIEDQTDEPASCPIPPRYDPELPAAVDEAIGIRGAYDRNLRATGRTLVGREADADGIPDVIRNFLALSEAGSLEDVGWDEWQILGAAQDLRAYYEEAALQLADVFGARQVESWFYAKTESGALLHEVTAALRAADGPDMVTSYLVPFTQGR
jgi:hypothetical protein